MIASTVGKNGRIYNFSAGATLPSIKGTNKVIILLGIHATFTLRTSHGRTSSFHVKLIDINHLLTLHIKYYTRRAKREICKAKGTRKRAPPIYNPLKTDSYRGKKKGLQDATRLSPIPWTRVNASICPNSPFF